jgi:hypothetical protein
MASRALVPTRGQPPDPALTLSPRHSRQLLLHPPRVSHPTGLAPKYPYPPPNNHPLSFAAATARITRTNGRSVTLGADRARHRSVVRCDLVAACLRRRTLRSVSRGYRGPDRGRGSQHEGGVLVVARSGRSDRCRWSVEAKRFKRCGGARRPGASCGHRDQPEQRLKLPWRSSRVAKPMRRKRLLEAGSLSPVRGRGGG